MFKICLVLLLSVNAFSMDTEGDDSGLRDDPVVVESGEGIEQEEYAGVFDRAAFWASLVYQKTLNWWDSKSNPWWSQVDPNTLVSGIQLHGFKDWQGMKDFAEARDKKLAILSLLRRHEVAGVFPFNPVSTQEFEGMGVKRDVLPTQDWRGLDYKTIKAGLEILKQNEADGCITGINCKAGVGRSVSLAIAKAVVDEDCKGKITLSNLPNRTEDYYTYLHFCGRVRLKRKNMSLSRHQKNALVGFIGHVARDEDGRQWLTEFKDG
jgi:hypothetical protein